MIVVESGGTKSTWVFENENKQTSITSVGLHPREINEQKISKINQLIIENNLQNREIYFYGAGCESEEAKNVIQQLLQNFGLQPKIVETDIHAACVAHLGNQKGVVGILGTGAVAAEFDGEKIIRRTSGLGYLIGDEGSGFDIGKRLLQLYYKDLLTSEIRKEIETYFENKSIIHRIYAPDGRFVIAGLTKIVYKYRENELINEVLSCVFDEFCEIALKPLLITDSVHFVGSIAYYFKNELRESLEIAGFQLGNVEKEAIYKLYEYISKLNS